MSIFEKKSDGQIEVPEGFMRGDGITKRTFYKIKIIEVTETTKPEVESKYIHKDTKKIISDYDYKYELQSDEERKNYIKVRVESGDLTTNTKEKDIYEQSKDNLDVGELALFINRTK